MIQKYSYFLILLFLPFLFFQCLGVSKAYAEKKYFLIEAETSKSETIPPKNTGLKIRRFSISQKFEGKEFVYRKDNITFESDFYNLFFIAPVSNLREELVKGLIAKKIFEWDSSSNSRMEPTHYLEVTVRQLYGDFRNSPKAILELEIFLYTENAGNTNVILKKTYDKSISIQTKEAGELVSGWSQAFSEILSEIDSDLKAKIVSK